ncbi:uncharacterized protein NPIL_466371 [Nephila pilipes]|uniref:Uncharacterized protein n=1 Tax=Nephila pilipes TaxID=299642 RepID=A0A8X6N2V4_NEPPI|nr:uncharacterized protein NPIL_466371 [Nephila pilipes]
MEYTIVPSLKYQVLLRIVTALWNRQSIRKLTWLSFHSSRHQLLEPLLKVIKDDINQLPLPKVLKCELMRLNEGIRLEIYKWNEYHNNEYRMNIIMPQNLFWEPFGSINYKKTAECLIQNTALRITGRFFLACMYGLENSIYELWSIMSTNDQLYFLSNFYFIYYWVEILRDPHVEGIYNDTLRKFNAGEAVFVFESSINMCDIFVSDYIFQKLRPEDKLILINWFEIISNAIYLSFKRRYSIANLFYTDTLYWLFHKLEKQERLRMLEMHSFTILFCYLQWPRQEFFLEMARYLFKFLSGKHFGYLLAEIAYKRAHAEDFDYGSLFEQFWRQSLEIHKKYVVGKKSLKLAFYHMFMVRDIQNIKMIFESTIDKQKQCILKSE